MQQLLQGAHPSAAAAELFGLLAPSDVPAVPRGRYAFRQAAHLLLHQTGVPAIPAVAITVGGAGNLSRHPPCCRHVESGAISPTSRITPRAETRRQHEHGYPRP